jgi:hypothetical protein
MHSQPSLTFTVSPQELSLNRSIDITIQEVCCLDYKKLIEADNLYYHIEPRGLNYDGYMKRKNWDAWLSPSVPFGEVELLFGFIKSWDRFFQGDKDLFLEIYKEIFPLINRVRNDKIEETVFSDELATEIRRAFDRVADCTGGGRYESTDASKILHTLVPGFFIMWDDKIKNETVQGGSNGAVYALKFLPKMQRELNEAIGSCMKHRQISRADATRNICDACHGNTLAKLVDEYNYVKYTKGHSEI